MREDTINGNLLLLIDDCMFQYYLAMNNEETYESLKLLLTHKLEKFLNHNDFIIICDDRVNTPEVIDNCELRCFVQINFDDNQSYVIRRKLSSMGCFYYE